MPNKRGSKVAASQARAKAAARKKAHSTGPVIAAAALTRPPEVNDDELEHEELDQVDEAAGVVEEEEDAAPARPPARAPRIARAGARREHQTAVAFTGVSLRREVGLIGAITASIGVALALLKLLTDLGT